MQKMQEGAVIFHFVLCFDSFPVWWDIVENCQKVSKVKYHWSCVVLHHLFHSSTVETNSLLLPIVVQSLQYKLSC